MRPSRDPVTPSPIGARLIVEEVLYDAERPVVFTTRSIAGQLLLAYAAGDTPDGSWFVLAACTQRTINGLQSGHISVHDALTSSWMWLAHEDLTGALAGVWPVTREEVPEEHLPAPGTPLYPEHEAALVTRAIGDEVSLGKIPASVVAFVADATRKAVKTLLDYRLSKSSEGRPTEEHRALYDLKIQRFAFSSFEVSFAPPDEDLFGNVELQQVAENLEAGLRWAVASTGEPLVATGGDEERLAILRASLLLTPPSGGPISEVEVSGQWISRGKVRLTRTARPRVYAEIRRLATERVVKIVGRVGQVDRDNLSFILRDTSDERDRKAIFPEDLLDDVLQALVDAGLVEVAGVERSGRLYIAAIAPADKR